MNPLITKRCSPIEEAIYQDGFQAGAASRDAEVARLKTVPMKYRRMAFNAQLQDEVAKLENERDQLREQVKMLSGVVERCNKYAKETLPTGYLAALTDEALAATEPKQ